MTDEDRAAHAALRRFFAELFTQNARDYEARYLPVQVNEESRAWVQGHINAWTSAAKLMREVEFKTPAKRISRRPTIADSGQEKRI
jgi:hypothetical protein